MTSPFKLRTLTFNTWAVPIVARHVNERMQAFLAYIATVDLDIIGFQEVFIPSVRTLLKEELKKLGYAYSIYFSSGYDLPSSGNGSGCMIVSRYPIRETLWHQFSMCGKIHRVDQWDHQSGKGIGMCRIILPDSYGTVDVYVSHFVAQYSDGIHDSYSQQRILQAFESSLFIRATRKSALTVLMADLNSGPASLVYRTLASLANLKDAYSCTHTPEENLYSSSTLTATRRTSTLAHPILRPSTLSSSSSESSSSVTHPSLPLPRSVDFIPSTSSETNKLRSIHDPTFGIPGNTYAATVANTSDRRSRFIEKFAISRTPLCDINSRLDYILFGSGQDLHDSIYTSSSGNASLLQTYRTWHVLSSDIRLSEPIRLSNGMQINLSDHSAVYAEFACVLITPTLLRSAGRVAVDTLQGYPSSVQPIHSVPSFGSIMSIESSSSEPNGSDRNGRILYPYEVHSLATTSRRTSSNTDPLDTSTSTLSAPQSSHVSVADDIVRSNSSYYDNNAVNNHSTTKSSSNSYEHSSTVRRRNSNHQITGVPSLNTVSLPPSLRLPALTINPMMGRKISDDVISPDISPLPEEMNPVSHHQRTVSDVKYTVNKSTREAERLLRQAIINAGVPIDRVAGHYRDDEDDKINPISLEFPIMSTLEHPSLPSTIPSHRMNRQVSFDTLNTFAEHFTLGIAAVLSSAANYARLLTPAENSEQQEWDTSSSSNLSRSLRSRSNSDTENNISRCTTVSTSMSSADNRIPEVLQATADALQRSILQHRQHKRNSIEANTNGLPETNIHIKPTVNISSPSCEIPVTPLAIETELVGVPQPAPFNTTVCGTVLTPLNDSHEIMDNLRSSLELGYDDCTRTRSYQLWVSALCSFVSWVSIIVCGMLNPSVFNVLSGLGSTVLFFSTLGIWFITLMHRKNILLHLLSTGMLVVGIPLSLYLLTFTNYIGLLVSLSVFLFIVSLRTGWTAVTATSAEIYSYQRALDQLEILTAAVTNNAETSDGLVNKYIVQA